MPTRRPFFRANSVYEVVQQQGNLPSKSDHVTYLCMVSLETNKIRLLSEESAVRPDDIFVELRPPHAFANIIMHQP